MANQPSRQPAPRKRTNQTPKHQPTKRQSSNKGFSPKKDFNVQDVSQAMGSAFEKAKASLKDVAEKKRSEKLAQTSTKLSSLTDQKRKNSATARPRQGSVNSASSNRSYKRASNQPQGIYVNKRSYSYKDIKPGSSKQNAFKQGAPKKSSSAKGMPSQTAPHSQGLVARILGLIKSIVAVIVSFFASIFSGSKKGKVIVVILLVLVVGGLGDSLINMGKIYPGVKVGSVDVGGKTQEEATQILNDTYASRVSANTVVFYADEQAKNNPDNSASNASIEEQISYEESLSNRTQWTTSAAKLGASFDAENTAEDAFQVGRDNGGIFTRIFCLFFGSSVDPQCTYDNSLFEELRYSISSALGNPRVNYSVTMNGSNAEVTEGHDGDEVAQDWLKSNLDKSFCSEDKTSSYVAKIEHAALQVTEKMAQDTAKSINNSIAKGATFIYEGNSWSASAEDLARWVSTNLVGSEGSYQLTPSFNESYFKNSLISHLGNLSNANSLQVSFSVGENSQTRVSCSGEGKIPDVSSTVTELNDSFFVQDARSDAPQIEISAIDIPESMTFDEAMSFGLIGEISSYTTQFSTGAEARNHNIRTACGYLTNSIAKANGGSWSFNDTAGETTEALGYQNAGAIVDGEYTDEIGGGICQVATTIYNAIYDAGYPIKERHNHTLYIASYPEGRDAAIAFPFYDLVWENDTSSDVLLVMSYTNSSVTATLYGVDPGYSVSTEYGEWEEGEKYSTKYKDDANLASGTEQLSSSGSNGSKITIVRTVKDSQGNVRSQQTFTSVYDPKDEVILRGTA